MADQGVDGRGCARARAWWLAAVVVTFACGGKSELEVGRPRAPTDPLSDAAAARDATTDAARDPPVDAGPIVCARARIAASVSLDDPMLSGLTPRVVPLPSGDTGVVYVSTDGDPTRVVWERVDASLARVTGPVTVSTDGFTWAEAVVREGEIFLAWGLAGDRSSVLQRIDENGRVLDAPRELPLYHPSVLRPSSTGLFWLAFAMRTDNALEMVHLALDGTRLHGVVTVDLGRYGSGHGAIPRGDGRSHVVTYPREGPPGAREGYVNAITETGELGPERRLSEDGDHTVIPVEHGSSLVVVRVNDDALVLERTDPTTLERIDAVSFPSIGRGISPATLADRLVIGYAQSGTFLLDDLGPDLAAIERTTMTLPSPTTGSGQSVATFPGALVFAITLVEGSRTYPWLARVECSTSR